MNTSFKPVHENINKSFLPPLAESIVPDEEKVLYSLLIRDGGLSIPTLIQCASIHYHQTGEKHVSVQL